jgi:hypothetical protein
MLQMKKNIVLNLIILALSIMANHLYAQIGYYDAPYTRYEADLGSLSNASIYPKSYTQSLLQSEASDQICVNLSNAGASVSWTVSADGDGLVVRYSVPDGQTSYLDVYSNNVYVTTLTLSTYYSWEYLSSNGDPNNVGVVNTNPKMRFDEVRYKLPSRILAGGNLKLVNNNGNIALDFAELEPVAAAVSSAGGDVYYGGNGSDLQSVIDANAGRTIYVPAGYYNIPGELYFGFNNTTLKGAGMWYTELHFTGGAGQPGGLRGNANNISYSGLYLSTVRNSRTNSYKGINGVYTSGSTISNVWAEHFECGAWIGQYNTGGPGNADGFLMSNCRFRNNYADGSNLCKGTVNAIVEHCSYRNNGDDDMGIWSANNQECQNNTFRYNTSENTWRASGCAVYGGLSNQFHDILIKDNLEVGIRVNNNFAGSPFNGGGMHNFYNIKIIAGGTYNDLFNNPVGAIDIEVTDPSHGGAGTQINNVTFSCIDIIDSKNDAIDMTRSFNGDGFYNLIFQNITIDGTGREYPNNSNGGGNGGARGYGLLVWNYPSGYGTYCNMNYSNIGGNASSNTNTGQIGGFNFSQAGSCPTGCSIASSVTITSGTTFGICTTPITFTATATAPASNTVSYVEFFVDGTSIGQDNSSPYSMTWNNPTVGTHQVTAVARYSPSNTTSTSAIQTIYVADGIYSTATPPIIDGIIDGSWSSYKSFTLTQGYNNPPDLAASFKIRYDATNLYVLVDVTDNSLQNPFAADAANYYNDDDVEVYIDWGNKKNTSYGATDFQYALVWNKGSILENKHGALTGVTSGQTTKAGNLGYTMEMKFPWSTIGGVPAAGSYMGFDVTVNDDDGGTGRNHQLDWNESDGTFSEWNNPSLFGTLQIANCNNPLPVELLTFTGEKQKGVVTLNWATATEINNKEFIIERSIDASDWNAIGGIAGAGNSNSRTNYSFTDYNSSDGMAYYRLRQVDVDGKLAYSNVVVIQASGTKSVSISPNPFEDELTFKGNVQGNVEIKILDLSGRLLYDANLETNDGTLTLRPELPSGAYIVTIQTATFIEQQKVIKR